MRAFMLAANILLRLESVWFVKVEAEGGEKGQGMWAQTAADLTPTELKKLEAVVTDEIQKQPNIKIVALKLSGRLHRSRCRCSEAPKWQA